MSATTLSDNNQRIRRAAVLGAGVMGAQLAAHFANAGIPVALFELAASEGNPNAQALAAIKHLGKLKPAPLASATAQELIQAANYDDDLDLLTQCDLVIEAITERPDIKEKLYRTIAPALGQHTLLVSNTSGLSINQLAQPLPAEIRARFCGVHFFNPPRYMHLVELIPHAGTDPAVLERLEGFLTRWLGKGVVIARDTPNFIANRVGVFSMLAVLHHATRLELPLDLVDKLTGPGIGRPKSATFRTADVVGLDTFAHVVDTLQQSLPDDPWAQYYRLPGWMTTLIDNGQLGQKSGAGIYRKEGREIHVLEPADMSWRRVSSSLDPQLRTILKERDPARKFAALGTLDHPQAEFLLAIFRDLFHYCAVHLESISDTARDTDLALRWGFGWQLGPFETWQAAGWQPVREQLEDDIAAGRTMADTPLPDWVAQRDAAGVHQAQGSWSADRQAYEPRRAHPVYRRQIFPDRVLGEIATEKHVLWENDGVELWHSGDDIGILGFKTRMHTVDDAVLDGILHSVDMAVRQCSALVLWQSEAPFCAGANLKMVLELVAANEHARLREIVQRFQQATAILRYAPVPTVAAVEGLALGGGCELLLHCDHVVAALESYIGLVEVGVGLIPAAGGSKEMALRAAASSCNNDVFPCMANHFETLAYGKVAGSAQEAKQFGFLRPADTIVFHSREILHVAKQQATALAESAYRPPQAPARFAVAGRAGVASLTARLVNLREGGFISAHDFLIGNKLASVMSGGNVDPGAQVSEDWLLKLELDAFMELLETEQTQARVQHMLENGKPLRN